MPMAVDMLSTRTSGSSTSSASSSASVSEAQYRAQMATDNSATFIPCSARSRHSVAFVPAYRPRTNLSSTPVPLQATNSQSVPSNPASSRTASQDRQRFELQRTLNPILNNPLLNHRREALKPSVQNISMDSLCVRPLSAPNQSAPNNRRTSCCLLYPPSPPPPILLARPTERISDRVVTSTEKTQQTKLPTIEKMKQDYISRWIYEVRVATYSLERYAKTKFAQKRVIYS